MTEGAEWKLILLFTLPLMAGNLLQQLYNTVDGIIVGNFVGPGALSSVGTCTPLTMLFIALAMGMSTGCSIVVSQYFGAKRIEDMRKSVATSMILLTLMGAVLSIVGYLASGFLLRVVLNVEDAYLADAMTYFSIYALGLVFQFIYNISAAILRSLGDSSATLYFLLVSSVANVVLDLWFVIGFHWGVAGAAVATVISQFLSAVVCVIYMFKKHSILRFQKGEFRYYPDKGALAMKLGIPTTLQQCVVSCGHLAVQRLINSFELTNAGLMAGYTAAMRIENFVLIPVFGFNMGVATFTGQNIGAGKYERVSKGLWRTELMGVGTCLAMGIVAYVFASPLVRLFGLDGDALGYGVQYLHFLSPLFSIFCFYLVLAGVIQGSGDVMWSAAATVSSLVFRVCTAYLLAYATPVGYAAAWVSIPLGWVWALLIVGFRYKFGPWRDQGIIKPEKTSEG